MTAKRIIISLLLTLHCVLALANPHNAVVRITNGGSMGSGCVFTSTDTHVWILTNAHVAGQTRGNRVQVEFFYNGRISTKVPGVVGAAWYRQGGHRDIAMVAVDRSRLGQWMPSVIPIAPAGSTVNWNHVLTIGCPQGRWPSAMMGHGFRHESYAGDVVLFYPAPAPGRSGSAILSADGKQIIGLIAWRSDGGSGDGRAAGGPHGIAMTHKEIHAAWTGETEADGDRPRDWVEVNAIQRNDLLQAHIDGKQRRIFYEGRTRDDVYLLASYPGEPENLFWVHSQYVQCPDGRCFPWQQGPRQQPQPQPQPPFGGGGGQSPLPPDLGGGQPQPQGPNLGDYVRRSELDEALRLQLGLFREDFLRRLEDGKVDEESLIERVKEALKGAAEDRKEDITDKANSEGGWLMFALGSALTIGGGALGIGGWKLWAAHKALRILVARREGAAERPFRGGE